MSVMEPQGPGTSKWTVKREHHNDRSRVEESSDPMHPNGRCVCGGEGECSWCVCFREGGDGGYTIDDAFEDLDKALVGANVTLHGKPYLAGRNRDGQQADRRVVEAMDTMRPPGVPFSEETANAIWQVDAPPLENFAPGAFVTPGFTRTLTSDASTFDAGEFSREEAGANLARLNQENRELRDHLKIITEERDEYQRKWQEQNILRGKYANATDAQRSIVTTFVTRLMNGEPIGEEHLCDIEELRRERDTAEVARREAVNQLEQTRVDRDEYQKRYVDLQQRIKTKTDDRNKYQRKASELAQEFEAMRIDRNEQRADVIRLEKHLDPMIDEIRDLKAELESWRVDQEHYKKLLRAAESREDTKTVDVDEQLFLVWREYGAAPTKPHSSFESARAEASRLAKANAGHRFYVLGAVGNAKTPKVEAEFVLSDGRFDDREEIPF